MTKKFYEYLLNKEEEFVTKDQIKIYYDEFVQMWNLKSNFNNTFQVLKNQKKIIYIFENYWRILEEIEIIKLKNNEMHKLDLIIEFLEYKKINWYYGLESARNFLGEWQMLKILTIINIKYQKQIKINNQIIRLIKIPKKYFIEKAIIQKNNIKYSDFEKTYLDEIYFHLKNKNEIIKFNSENINFNTLNLYLNVFSDFLELKTYILNNLDKKYLKQIE